ncbi:MAG: hypothetical protein PUC88_06870 [Clostridia bacterium]|nr:hypothetical protein [Clostridia bacterium]
MKKILAALGACTLIFTTMATSYALDPIVSPVAPVYSDSDSATDSDTHTNTSPNAPITGDITPVLLLLAGGSAVCALVSRKKADK